MSAELWTDSPAALVAHLGHQPALATLLRKKTLPVLRHVSKAERAAQGKALLEELQRQESEVRFFQKRERKRKTPPLRWKHSTPRTDAKPRVCCCCPADAMCVLPLSVDAPAVPREAVGFASHPQPARAELGFQGKAGASRGVSRETLKEGESGERGGGGGQGGESGGGKGGQGCGGGGGARGQGRGGGCEAAEAQGGGQGRRGGRGCCRRRRGGRRRGKGRRADGDRDRRRRRHRRRRCCCLGGRRGRGLACGGGGRGGRCWRGAPAGAAAGASSLGTIPSPQLLPCARRPPPRLLSSRQHLDTTTRLARARALTRAAPYRSAKHRL